MIVFRGVTWHASEDDKWHDDQGMVSLPSDLMSKEPSDCNRKNNRIRVAGGVLAGNSSDT
jgi:hypothetical protein